MKPRRQRAADHDLGLDAHREVARKASRREVTLRLDSIATALNFAHEQLSEVRHDLGVADRLEVMQRRNVDVL